MAAGLEQGLRFGRFQQLPQRRQIAQIGRH
jgi:hypothetical protein